MESNVRTLSFLIKDQIIEKDPDCDFSGLVAGTKGYYVAKFSFSESWTNYKKIAVFKNRSTTKFVPIINDMCQIPDEITTSLLYRVSVVGNTRDISIPTTETFVTQKRGGMYG